jgi:hypothetical protein
LINVSFELKIVLNDLNTRLFELVSFENSWILSQNLIQVQSPWKNKNFHHVHHSIFNLSMPNGTSHFHIRITAFANQQISMQKPKCTLDENGQRKSADCKIQSAVDCKTEITSWVHAAHANCTARASFPHLAPHPQAIAARALRFLSLRLLQPNPPYICAHTYIFRCGKWLHSSPYIGDISDHWYLNSWHVSIHLSLLVAERISEWAYERARCTKYPHESLSLFIFKGINNSYSMPAQSKPSIGLS